MTNIKSAYLKLFIPLFLIIITAILVGFFIKDTIRYSEEYLKGKSEFLDIENKIRSFSQKESNFNRAQRKISIIDNAFLRSDDNIELANFLLQLEDLAKRNNTLIEVKSVTSPTKEKPYFTFQFVIKGNFTDFLKFLSALENIPFEQYRLLEIQKIIIKRVITREGQDIDSLQVFTESEVEINVYAK